MPNPSTPTPTWENPMATDGFEFIEYATPEPERLGAWFEQMGFTAVARHRSKNVVLYRQGDANFIVNAEPDSVAASFATLSEPAICAMAFRVKNAARAYKQALTLGAWEAEVQAGVMELRIPAIVGIGDTLIYLIDRYEDRSIYDVDFLPIPGVARKTRGAGLVGIDYVAHNVQPGRVQEWVDFYAHLFNFRELPDDQDGRLVAGPCGKIRIRIDEPSGDATETASGEGIAYVALATPDLAASVKALRKRGVEFVEASEGPGSSLRRRTRTVVPPIFFEIGAHQDVTANGTGRPS